MSKTLTKIAFLTLLLLALLLPSALTAEEDGPAVWIASVARTYLPVIFSQGSGGSPLPTPTPPPSTVPTPTPPPASPMPTPTPWTIYLPKIGK